MNDETSTENKTFMNLFTFNYDNLSNDLDKILNLYNWGFTKTDNTPSSIINFLYLQETNKIFDFKIYDDMEEKMNFIDNIMNSVTKYFKDENILNFINFNRLRDLNRINSLDDSLQNSLANLIETIIYRSIESTTKKNDYLVNNFVYGNSNWKWLSSYDMPISVAYAYIHRYSGGLEKILDKKLASNSPSGNWLKEYLKLKMLRLIYACKEEIYSKPGLKDKFTNSDNDIQRTAIQYFDTILVNGKLDEFIRGQLFDSTNENFTKIKNRIIEINKIYNIDRINKYINSEGENIELPKEDTEKDQKGTEEEKKEEKQEEKQEGKQEGKQEENQEGDQKDDKKDDDKDDEKEDQDISVGSSKLEELEKMQERLTILQMDSNNIKQISELTEKLNNADNEDEQIKIAKEIINKYSDTEN